jgi:hypothetical protein
MLKKPIYNPNIRFVPIGFNFPGDKIKHNLENDDFYNKLAEIGLPEDDTLLKIAYLREKKEYHVILKFIFGASQDLLSFEKYEPDLDNVENYKTHFERLNAKYIDQDVFFVNSVSFKDLKLDFVVDSSGRESLLLSDIFIIQNFPYKSKFNLKFLSNKVQLPDFTFKDASNAIDLIIRDAPKVRPYSEFVKDFTSGMQSLYLVMSCIEAESGIKQKIKNPWEDFESFKVYLDSDTLKKIQSSYAIEKSKVKIDLDDLRFPVIGESLSERYADRLPPGFDFSFVLTEPALQYLLDLPATYGALVMAANELGFKLVDLIRSPKVNYMFAQFVARKWISPKQVGFVSGIVGNQRQVRISSGLQVSMANEKWIMGCKIWFKSVSVRKQPIYYQKWDELHRLISPFRLEEIPQTLSEFDANPKFDPIRNRRNAIFEARQELWAYELLPSVLEK